MKNLEKLKKIIIEVVPEIMEFRNGDIVETRGDLCKTLHQIKEIHNDFYCTTTRNLHLNYKEFTTKIRPITLNDCVATIRKGRWTYNDLKDFILSWDCRNDDLSKQNEDLIERLLDLLT